MNITTSCSSFQAPARRKARPCTRHIARHSTPCMGPEGAQGGWGISGRAMPHPASLHRSATRGHGPVSNQGARPCQQPGGKAMSATRGHGPVSNQGARPAAPQVAPSAGAPQSGQAHASWCPQPGYLHPARPQLPHSSQPLPFLAPRPTCGLAPGALAVALRCRINSSDTTAASSCDNVAQVWPQHTLKTRAIKAQWVNGGRRAAQQGFHHVGAKPQQKTNLNSQTPKLKPPGQLLGPTDPGIQPYCLGQPSPAQPSPAHPSPVAGMSTSLQGSPSPKLSPQTRTRR